MGSKAYPIAYNKDYYTVMANDIIKGKQEMTLQEARIIRLLITQVVKQDKDLKTYICRVSDLSDFLGVTSQTLYRDVRDICDSLLRRIIRIGTGNPKEPWEIFQWVQLAKYDGKGTITLMLSEQLKPYVLELDKWFTQYPLGNILAMQSFYAIRLYELMRCQDGITRLGKEYHELTVNYLREYFCCENKYQRISQFKEKVIEIAVREINEKSDLFIEIEYIKTGKTVTSIKFYISTNYKKYEKQHKIIKEQVSLFEEDDEFIKNKELVLNH